VQALVQHGALAGRCVWHECVLGCGRRERMCACVCVWGGASGTQTGAGCAHMRAGAGSRRAAGGARNRQHAPAYTVKLTARVRKQRRACSDVHAVSSSSATRTCKCHRRSAHQTGNQKRAPGHVVWVFAGEQLVWCVRMRDTPARGVWYRPEWGPYDALSSRKLSLCHTLSERP
jgi:hypothetical protein